MSVAQHPSPNPDRPGEDLPPPSSGLVRFKKSETTVSGYDRLSAWLVATIMIVGFFTTILFLVWITTTTARPAPPGYEISEPIGDDGNEKPEGFEDDILEPGVEDFPEVDTPQLAQALEAVTDAVSSVRASLDKRSGDAAQMGKGGGYGSREGGPGGGGDGVPEHKRWKINYEASDIESYRKQLSFWNIDIGVVNRSNDQVFRIKDPGGSATVVKTDRSKESKSLYFAHAKPRMMRWDEEIANKAGVDTGGSNVIQFYSNKARSRIREQEGAFIQKDGKVLKNIRETIIKLAPTGGGYDFIVEEVRYRS